MEKFERNFLWKLLLWLLTVGWLAMPIVSHAMPETSESVIQAVDGITAHPVDEASYLFDSSALRRYDLEIAPEELETLNSAPAAEVYVPATLVFEGRRYEKVGVRYKGSLGAFVLCTGPSYQKGLLALGLTTLPRQVAFFSLVILGVFLVLHLVAIAAGAQRSTPSQWPARLLGPSCLYSEALSLRGKRPVGCAPTLSLEPLFAVAD